MSSPVGLPASTVLVAASPAASAAAVNVLSAYELPPCESVCHGILLPHVDAPETSPRSKPPCAIVIGLRQDRNTVRPKPGPWSRQRPRETCYIGTIHSYIGTEHI